MPKIVVIMRCNNTQYNDRRWLVMNEKFSNTKRQEMEITDDAIIFINTELEVKHIIPYGRMKDVKLTKTLGIPSFDVIDKETIDGKINIHHGYMYEFNQKEKLQEMVTFVKERIKSAPSIEVEPQKPFECNLHVIDSLSFSYKNHQIRIGKGLFAKKIPVTSITTCDGMSYWEDIAFHKVEIKFNAEQDRYIIKGRTYDSVKDIPFKDYYDNMVKDSAMPTEEKLIALQNKTFAGVELFAKGVTSGVITQSNSNTEKDASVIGRAVVGAAIAGPTGAIVGALSAVDKNNKKKDKE